MPSEPVVDLFQLAGTTLDGRFGVEAVIAEGGFGIVYRARQAALDRAIALKVLKMPPRFDEVAKQQFLAGFAKEARTIARISHPNIVQVYDFGVSTMPSGVQAPWMALEWLTGTTLEDALLARRGAGGRTPAECLVILRPILEALSIVHAAGVAHRDLKPANIMMVAMPTGTMPKLLDFGIAKIMDADEAPGTGSTQTRSHQIAFSPGYAAPEQISGGRSGPWTDVHAMALVATEMLVDRTPLEGNEQTLLFQQILDRLRPSPAKFGVDVGAWEAVLLRALAVSPSERFRDAGELLGALEARLAEASSTRRILPSGVSVPELSMAGAVDTLAVMSTQQAPVAPVAAVSVRSPVTTTGGTTEADAGIPRKTTRSSRYAALAALVVVGTGAVLWIAGRPAAPAAIGAQVTASVAPLPSLPAPPTSAVSAEPPPSSSAPSQASASTAPSAAPSARAARGPPPRATSAASTRPAAPAAPSQAPKPNCNPPYVIDPQGHRQFKPECL